jgi:hypothetical protein
LSPQTKTTTRKLTISSNDWKPIFQIAVLAQESGIESRIALRGNHMPGHCQASDNITVGTRDNALAKTPCIDTTHI